MYGQPSLRPFGQLPQAASATDDYLDEDPIDRVKRLAAGPGHTSPATPYSPAWHVPYTPMTVPEGRPREEYDIPEGGFSAARQNDRFAQQAEDLNSPTMDGRSYVQRLDAGEHYPAAMPPEFQPERQLTPEDLRLILGR